MWFFLRLEVAPTLDPQRARQEVSIVAAFTWLREEFHGLMEEMPARQYLLLEPLRMLQHIGELALSRDHKPKANHVSRSNRSTAKPAPKVISPFWSEFLDECPHSKKLLTCFAKVLTELDSGTFDFQALTWRHRDPDSLQSYERASELFKWIIGVGLTHLPALPSDNFPHWQIAYRNGEKDIAFEGWQEYYNSQEAIDQSDPFGVTLTLMAVEAEDIAFINDMSKCQETIGHFRGCGCLYLSSFEYAALIDSEDSYSTLVRTRDGNAHYRCLELAISAGAGRIVTLLTDSSRLEHLIIISYHPLICQAINANQPGIAWSLVKLETYFWPLGVGNPPVEEYATLAESKKLNDLARKLRNMDLSEPQAGPAFEQIFAYGPQAGM